MIQPAEHWVSCSAEVWPPGAWLRQQPEAVLGYRASGTAGFTFLINILASYWPTPCQRSLAFSRCFRTAVPSVCLSPLSSRTAAVQSPRDYLPIVFLDTLTRGPLVIEIRDSKHEGRNRSRRVRKQVGKGGMPMHGVWRIERV